MSITACTQSNDSLNEMADRFVEATVGCGTDEKALLSIGRDLARSGDPSSCMDTFNAKVADRLARRGEDAQNWLVLDPYGTPYPLVQSMLMQEIDCQFYRRVSALFGYSGDNHASTGYFCDETESAKVGMAVSGGVSVAGFAGAVLGLWVRVANVASIPCLVSNGFLVTAAGSGAAIGYMIRFVLNPDLFAPE